MPVDFQTYFLSSSPPGFDLESYASEHFLKQNVLGFGFQSVNSPVAGKTFCARDEQPDSILGNVEMKNITSPVNAERIMSWNQSYENFSALSDVETPSAVDKNSVATMGKKKVSFADDVGLALEEVRMMEDSSDVPPVLRTDLIARLDRESAAPLCLENVRYVLNFPQPLSDYLALRNKIESDKVSLETATVRSTSVLGTVRVKNIVYEKRVFVRVTCDDWETHDDIVAAYSTTTGSQSTSSYDTFEFVINLATVDREVNKICFAICYEAGSEQFWDNNNGENYEIVSLVCEAAGNGRNGPDTKVFSLTPENSWTDFSNWDGIGSCDPYW